MSNRSKILDHFTQSSRFLLVCALQVLWITLYLCFVSIATVSQLQLLKIAVFQQWQLFPRVLLGNNEIFGTNICMRNTWQKRTYNIFILVVETTVLLDDLKDYATVNEIYSNCKLLYRKYWCAAVSDILQLVIMKMKFTDFNPWVTSLCGWVSYMISSFCLAS